MDPHASHAYVVSALCAADPIELSDFVGCISFGDQPGLVLVENQHVQKILIDYGFLSQREIQTDFLKIEEIFWCIFLGFLPSVEFWWTLDEPGRADANSIYNNVGGSSYEYCSLAFRACLTCMYVV